MIKLKGILKVIFVVIGLGIFSTTSASIINTINGSDYEWMELTATAGMSRVEVETLLSDPGSALYGFRYATRVEASDLLHSYYDTPIEYNQWNSYMVPGAQNFFADFGVLFYDNSAPASLTTADGVDINYNMSVNSYFMYGSEGECGVDVSCLGRMFTIALDGVLQAQFAPSRRGWDSSHPDPDTRLDTVGFFTTTGSLLVADINAVPIPPAIYLFGSGMLGLIVIARRKVNV